MVRLKDLFNLLASCWRYPATKTYVLFTFDGAVKPRVAEVTGRDIKMLDIPDHATSFCFFDRDVKRGRKYDDAALVRRAHNFSPTYFFGERLLTPREFYDMGEEERVKLKGFYNQDTHQDSRIVIDGTICRTVNSRWRPHEAVIHRRTREQLWPPQRLPLFGPKQKGDTP